jgi:hypothetical protein
MDHIAHMVFAGESHLGDLGHRHALGGEQYHLRSPPGHHRPPAAAHDPQQPTALVIIDLTDPYTFSHPNRGAAPRPRSPTVRTACRKTGPTYGATALDSESRRLETEQRWSEIEDVYERIQRDDPDG